MIWPALLLIPLCAARVLPRAKTPPTIRQLAQFPNQTWIESVAVRPNGQLLVTLFSSPELYQIDPSQENQVPKLVATVPNALGMLGISEIEPDVFAITQGNFSSVTGNVDPESFAVSKVDFTGHKKKPAVSLVARLPDATLLNGATTAGDGSNVLLMTDSIAGVIWRLNLETTEYDLLLNVTETQPTAPLLEGGWGANGIHAKDGFLYFTNSDRGFFRVPIRRDGTPKGNIEQLSEQEGMDDFTFDKKGNAYLARGDRDLIDKVTPAGKERSLKFANENALVLVEGNTGVAFGRRECDKKTLYVSTNGGWTGLVEGTQQQGGRVLAIDLE